MNAAVMAQEALRLLEEEMAARRYAQTTRAEARASLGAFLEWGKRTGNTNLLGLQKKELVSYHVWLAQQVSHRTGELLAANTVRTRFSYVKMAYSCLYRAALLTHNPTQGLELEAPRVPGYKRRPLTREEITRFLEALDGDSAQGLKDRSLFELIYSSGLRVSEAAGLKVGDIDFERRLMVVRGKFDRDRRVPLSEVACEFLKKHLGVALEKPQQWVFRGSRGPTGDKHIRSMSISERFRKLLRDRDMDYKDISTHSIRHSTATHLLENGASVRHVQELLGHQCITSTVRYTHVMTDGLAKVYRRHHPREHELFETVDEEYEKRLGVILNHATKPRKKPQNP